MSDGRVLRCSPFEMVMSAVMLLESSLEVMLSWVEVVLLAKSDVVRLLAKSGEVTVEVPSSSVASKSLSLPMLKLVEHCPGAPKSQ